MVIQNDSVANWKVWWCSVDDTWCQAKSSYDSRFNCLYYDPNGVLPGYWAYVVQQQSGWPYPSFSALQRITNPLSFLPPAGLGASYQKMLEDADDWDLPTPVDRSQFPSYFTFACGYSSAAPTSVTVGSSTAGGLRSASAVASSVGSGRISPAEASVLRPVLQALYDEVNEGVSNEQTRNSLLAPLSQALRVVNQAFIPVRRVTLWELSGSGGNPSRLKARHFLKDFLNVNEPGPSANYPRQSVRFAKAAQNILATLEEQELAADGIQ